MSVVAFQTRARTIDHLGRGQIADAPTAVSELWKNAYDAYARSVALHIFDGQAPIAAVTDDGHEMDHEEFLNKWLVVGTDTKLSEGPTPREDRNGLPVRVKQGEKGIGRLSIAFLGPQVFVISKRRNRPFVAALVDWRLFENPFLLLADIRLPVQHFEDSIALAALLPTMFDQVGDNVSLAEGILPEASDDERERRERLRDGWERYSAIQRRNKQPDTAAEIRKSADSSTALADALLGRCLSKWPVWTGDAAQGTALFVLDVNHELAVWVDPTVPDDDPEATHIKNSLLETLVGFVDPYLETPAHFTYRVTVHKAEDQTNIVSSDGNFFWGDLRALEHLVEGSVDDAGVFRGRVKAFGKDVGQVTIPPPDRPAPIKPRAVIGPFAICIGSYESETKNTSMSPEQHRHVTNMAENYAGLAIYRDQLRVMPYGRAQADYFGIEERRSFHAGRWFWSYRRTFGRVAISREENPNLKDKAGREGLIDNQAKREFRNLVVELLKATAQRYFGTDSPVRKDLLPEIVTTNKAAREAEEAAQDRRKAEFRRALRDRSPAMKSLMQIAVSSQAEIDRVAAAGDLTALFGFENTILQLEAKKTELKLPAKPAILGSVEDEYRTYRDQYADFCVATDQVRTRWAEAVEKVKKRPAVEESQATAAAHDKQLEQSLLEWQARILTILRTEDRRLRESVQHDRQRYVSQTTPMIADLTAGRTKLPDSVW